MFRGARNWVVGVFLWFELFLSSQQKSDFEEIRIRWEIQNAFLLRLCSWRNKRGGCLRARSQISTGQQAQPPRQVHEGPRWHACWCKSIPGWPWIKWREFMGGIGGLVSKLKQSRADCLVKIKKTLKSFRWLQKTQFFQKFPSSYIEFHWCFLG